MPLNFLLLLISYFYSLLKKVNSFQNNLTGEFQEEPFLKRSKLIARED
jgi:hypothetical protein